MNDDPDLLRRYITDHAEDAFASLVQRHLRLVYGTALRRTNGDSHLAEEIAQEVFARLAREADSLQGHPVLHGWLYVATRYAAANAMRSELRRKTREEKADPIQSHASLEPAADWSELRPELDSILDRLDSRERDAIFLRFFEQRTFADVGRLLSISEDAARMRVERALEKLRTTLAHRGVTSTAAALGVAIAAQANVTLPAGLAATICAITGAATSTGAATFFAMTKLQFAALSVVAAAGTIGYFLQADANRRLRTEIDALGTARQETAALRTENQRLAAGVAEAELLRRDDFELKQLSERIATAQKANAAKIRLARQRSAAPNPQIQIDRMNREGNVLVERYKALQAQAKDPSLSPEARTQADANAKLKLAEIQAKQREIQAFIKNLRITDPGYQPNPGVTYEARRSVPPSGGGAPALKHTDRVSTTLPDADLSTAFAAYELYSGMKIVRDPSLTNARNLVDLKTEKVTRDEMLQLLRQALQQQANVVLEPTGDGRMLAKLGPNR